MFTTKVGGEFKWSSRWSSLLPNRATIVLNLPAQFKFLVVPGKQASVNAEHCKTIISGIEVASYAVSPHNLLFSY